MVEDMKKKMHRLEHLIGFEGKLDVTSRDSMKVLISALASKYKSDVQSSLRLHGLEFFHDLVKNDGRSRQEFQDEAASIKAQDIDDWKDLMSLSRIYYVLEHPRSKGLSWKRRISKKKRIDVYGDTDLIEWRVSQNFCLHGLEEWHQRRNDALKLLEEHTSLDDDPSIEESQETSRELNELFRLYESPDQKFVGEKVGVKKRKKLAVDRPFTFQDECLEDWTESYSEDSEHSDVEDFDVEDMNDFLDEMEHKLPRLKASFTQIGEFREVRKEQSLDVEEDEDISKQLLSKKGTEFSQYRSSVFEMMDQAEAVEEWFELYNKTRIVTDKTSKLERGMSTLAECEEETEDLPEVEPHRKAVEEVDEEPTGARSQVEDTVGADEEGLKVESHSDTIKDSEEEPLEQEDILEKMKEELPEVEPHKKAVENADEESSEIRSQVDSTEAAEAELKSKLYSDIVKDSEEEPQEQKDIREETKEELSKEVPHRIAEEFDEESSGSQVDTIGTNEEELKLKLHSDTIEDSEEESREQKNVIEKTIEDQNNVEPRTDAVEKAEVSKIKSQENTTEDAKENNEERKLIPQQLLAKDGEKFEEKGAKTTTSLKQLTEKVSEDQHIETHAREEEENDKRIKDETSSPSADALELIRENNSLSSSVNDGEDEEDEVQQA